MSNPTRRAILLAAVLAVASAGLAQTPAPQRAQPIAAGEVPQRKKVAALPKRGSYVPPKTPWGDPDITGDYNNSDESGIPFERPDEYAGRSIDSFTPAELAKMVAQRKAQTIERTPSLSEFPGATSPMHWFENYFAANSRAWLVVGGSTPAVKQAANERQVAIHGLKQAPPARSGHHPGPCDDH